jgi:hypothetical protein
VLASGLTPHAVTPGTWYEMRLQMADTAVTALLDGAVLGTANDSTTAYGMAGIGCGWHEAWFDDFAVGNNTAAATA